METINEERQIKEVIKRLNYYEKGLHKGKKIKAQDCKLCAMSYRCYGCLAYLDKNYNCFDGYEARMSIRLDGSEPYSKRIIRKWQTELKRRANANLEAAGSKWRIEWEREE